MTAARPDGRVLHHHRHGRELRPGEDKADRRCSGFFSLRPLARCFRTRWASARRVAVRAGSVAGDRIRLGRAHRRASDGAFVREDVRSLGCTGPTTLGVASAMFGITAGGLDWRLHRWLADSNVRVCDLAARLPAASWTAVTRATGCAGADAASPMKANRKTAAARKRNHAGRSQWDLGTLIGAGSRLSRLFCRSMSER